MDPLSPLLGLCQSLGPNTTNHRHIRSGVPIWVKRVGVSVAVSVSACVSVSVSVRVSVIVGVSVRVSVSVSGSVAAEMGDK